MPGYDPSLYEGMAAEVLRASGKYITGVKGPQGTGMVARLNDPRYEDIRDPSPDRIYKSGRT